MCAPPKRGRPKSVIELDDVIGRILQVYGIRNRKYIPWEEDSAARASTIPDLGPSPDDDADDEDSEDADE